MANEEKQTKSNIFNFRTESKDKTKEFRRRKKQLSNKATFQAVFEDGLLVNEGKDLEGTILNKKANKMAKREKALDLVNRYNAEIKAHNLRLKALNPSRYKNLSEEDNVLKIKFYDKDGNLLYEL